MPVTLSQNNRLFKFTSPLGPDAFSVTEFNGREEFSQPFVFNLDLISSNTAVAAADLVGSAVGWALNFPGDKPRHFHGFVRRLTAGKQMSRTLRSYRIEVVPWLWFLTLTADCCIFQNKTTPDILKAVFGKFGFSAYELKLQGTYVAREYCVQYRETAFDFVSRLMEEEGIFYYFKFADGSHTMVIADKPAAYYDCDPHASVEFRPGQDSTEAVIDWDRHFEYRSGKWAHTDYNFETPATNLLTNAPTTKQLPNMNKFEVFDYPGRYSVSNVGTNLVKVRMEEVEVRYDTAVGSGRCSSFAPGAKFELKLHPADNAKYVLIAVEHSGSEGPLSGVQSGVADYSNSFVCMPDTVPFRPARVTPRPRVYGPQPALVTGPSGEEIYTDKYGRIKAQFYWDRVGTKDENSSCWMRVAEMWAGKNWGMISTPRIGQEVIVEFLEGDPDQPIVTGRVYNAEQMPPYDLPTNQTQSGLKTRSSKQGGTADFNELRFEDKKGEEDMYFHAQKDFHRFVEHDDDLQVEGNQTIKIKLDRTEELTEGNESIVVKKGNRTEEVTEGDETVTVKKGKRTLTVEGDDTHTVKTGKRTLTVETGDDIHTVKTGNRQASVDTGNEEVTVKAGNIQIKASAGAITIEAAQGITLKCGPTKVEIKPDGVKVSGVNIALAAQAQFKAEGQATAEISASGMTTVKGAMVMIN